MRKVSPMQTANEMKNYVPVDFSSTGSLERTRRWKNFDSRNGDKRSEKERKKKLHEGEKRQQRESL